MTELRIVLPAISSDKVSTDLRHLTRAIAKVTGEQLAGGLGGPDGYGFDYETSVFSMFPFWWGDCLCGWQELSAEWLDAHPHSNTCYQSELERRGAWNYRDSEYDPNLPAHDEVDCFEIAREWGLPETGAMMHCTCEREPAYQAWERENPHMKTCPEMRPNFLYKPTGAEVNFYKYIGRGMEIDGDLPADFLTSCLESLGEK
ncbi:hypothetical protein [Nocardia flavorosea]|uniref:Uncharacterized protein n=1 Tax=Nocardia flavorosea TaxID=53429 RepID=A0A846YMP2_9NOCA|nr:hypothetical protein [Nocardia flavorosea]NKY60377.1 hypothetical protein [Nocardia flavorosea]